jgi:Na+/H+-dicarboxylate symporter/ABC-type amino acid transport substrate-binding protein
VTAPPPAPPAPAARAGRRLSLSMRILIGLALGIAVGLFFGEPASMLQPLADIYIRLMQVTVLPYLVMSLVVGFGQLEARQARRLALRAGALLLATWALTCVVIAVMPAAFPAVQSASFFSHSLVEPRQPFSLPDLYFTANPFHSLSNAVVPAVVLFSSMVGIGLIGLRDRERVLEPLRVLNAAVTRITLFVVRLTPIGVFAIGAVAGGTLTADTFQRLEVYLFVFAAASLLLAFWVLPLMVTAVTPFRYREVTGIASDALLTAFVASSAFIVLPILAERAKELLRRHGQLNTDSDSAADVLLPVLFNFPNAGRLLTLLFVPFAAWLAGGPFAVEQFARLFAVGVPSYFAKAQVALPFLLDVFELPHDLFQLYIPTTLIGGKFDSMVTAMNLLVFGLLGGAAMGGFLVFDGRRLAVAAAAGTAGIALTVVLTGLLLRTMIDTTYHMDAALKRMHAPAGASTSIVHKDRAGLTSEATAPGAVTLERIRSRGTLRVGYDPDYAPFSFFNSSGQLVGFDIELAERLADALGVAAEFVPVGWQELPQALAGNVIDLMPGVWYRPFWFSSLRLSEPYLTATMALVVRDERRHEFASIADLRRSRGLKIGVPLDIRQIAFSMKHYFGDAQVEFVALASPKKFFDGAAPDLDAFLLPAESGAAATLLHPEYSVVVPQPDPVTVPTGFGAALHSADLVVAVNEWIVFAKSEGQITRAYDYWVLGKGAETRRRRWSVMHDVLGWGR